MAQASDKAASDRGTSEDQNLKRGQLPVGDGHSIAWSINGPKDGVPVVLLHGGPGAGSSDEMHGIFTGPLFGNLPIRSILFDQRGCGASAPLGSVEANTTDHLIADMEQLRIRLDLESWIVAGGSWGTTLALRYAVAHPEPCRALLLRAVTIWSEEKFSWALEGRKAVKVAPWQALSNLLGADDWRSILTAYHEAVFGPDIERALEAACTWVAYENVFSAAEPGNFDEVYAGLDPETAMIKARIGLHYWKHQAFLNTGLDAAEIPDGLFNGVDRLADIPISIVHGTRDHICHPDFLAAWKRALPQAKIEMVPDAGHSLEHPALEQAFQQITADAVAAQHRNR